MENYEIKPFITETEFYLRLIKARRPARDKLKPKSSKAVQHKSIFEMEK